MYVKNIPVLHFKYCYILFAIAGRLMNKYSIHPSTSFSVFLFFRDAYYPYGKMNKWIVLVDGWNNKRSLAVLYFIVLRQVLQDCSVICFAVQYLWWSKSPINENHLELNFFFGSSNSKLVFFMILCVQQKINLLARSTKVLHPHPYPSPPPPTPLSLYLLILDVSYHVRSMKDLGSW